MKGLIVINNYIRNTCIAEPRKPRGWGGGHKMSGMEEGSKW